MLNLTELVGFGVSQSSIRIETGGLDSSTSNISTFTFSGVGIGTAAADRLLVIVIMAPCGSTETFNYCNVDAVASTEVISAETSDAVATICQIAKATGTTADIEVDFNGSMQGCAVRVYALYGANATAASTGTYTSLGDEILTANVTGYSDGVIIAGVSAKDTNDVAAPQWTWTNITEVDDVKLETAAYFSDGYNSSPAGVTSVTATYGAATLNQSALVAASWRPS